VKKIKLDLDSLSVETFQVATSETAFGTVHGNGVTVVSCGPDPMSKCGPNNCLPYTEPTSPDATC
jgi:hypothetical protein